MAILYLPASFSLIRNIFAEASIKCQHEIHIKERLHQSKDWIRSPWSEQLHASKTLTIRLSRSLNNPLSCQVLVSLLCLVSTSLTHPIFAWSKRLYPDAILIEFWNPITSKLCVFGKRIPGAYQVGSWANIGGPFGRGFRRRG